MTCCTVTLTPFINQATTTVPYSGDRPTVSVSYNMSGVWQVAGVATPIRIKDTEVIVDHGDPSAIGIVKLLQ